MDDLTGRKAKRRLGDASKHVIERWARMKRRQWPQAVGRAIARRVLPWRERKRSQALNETFETFKQLAIKNEHGRLGGLNTLLNIGLYLLIALRDIQVVKIDVLTHPDEWTRKLHARFILLTVYEWDANKVSGRSLRNALDVMLVSDDLKLEMIEVLRTLRLLQGKVKHRFRIVRNTAIAHRDPDALAQYRAIRDLDVGEVLKIAAEYFAAVEQFVRIHSKILPQASSAQSVLRQWAEAEKTRG